MSEDFPPPDAKSLARYASIEQVAAKLAVPVEHIRRAARRFPVLWPVEYLDLVADPDDAIARMGKPHPSEWHADPHDLADPVADRAFRPLPFVVHKHVDRIVILVSAQCHFYCRFCFRRDQDVAHRGRPSNADWELILAYLQNQPDISEVILSGGDPLTLEDGALFSIRDRLAEIPHLRKWRIHTRAPATFPARFHSALMRGLAEKLPCTIVAHFNHPREITEQTSRISRLCAKWGIALGNQAVLLKSINDSAETQIDLWRTLAKTDIFAHYLHHPDRVAGNAAFRVSLRRGKNIYADVLNTLGTQAPRYVLDLPDGRGKVPVMDLESQSDGTYWYRHPDGSISRYHDLDRAKCYTHAGGA